MSRIRADRYTNRAGTGAPTFSDGVNVVGITSVKSGAGVTTLEVTGDLSVISGTIKGASELSISGIASSISDTAVDVFVYDTSKDSDGGAWRKRTQNTSWYNEGAGTYRGSRKEFPAVAVIVAEETKVTIYDGDDPDLPMWMIFENGGNDPFLDGSTPGSTFLGNYAPTSVSAFNGIICVGTFRSSGALTNLNAGLRKFSFIEDACYATNDTNTYKLGTTFVDRRTATMSQIAQGGAIANANAKDVAMTVLPNAPIDSATGLPIPTIAVATDNVTSVIRDNASVVDYTGFNPIEKVAIDSRYVYASTRSGVNDYIFKTTFLSADGQYDVNITAGSGGFYVNSVGAPVSPTLKNMTVTGTVVAKDHTYIRSGNDGIEIFDGNVITVDADTSIIPIAYITSEYNTGYMLGDIKGAFLSDTSTVDRNAVTENLIVNGTFDSNTNNWTAVNGATLSVSSNRLVITGNGSSAGGGATQSFTTVVGQQYILSYVAYAGSINSGQIRIGTSSNSFNITFDNSVTSSAYDPIYFTATGTTTFVTLGLNAGLASSGSFEYDNISVTPVEEDRSVNNKGLQVFGTVTKSAVATGAELVSYSGINASNYLQSASGSISIGTDDFCVSFWYKRSTGDEINVFFDFVDGTANGFRVVPGNSANDIYLVNGNFTTFTAFAGKAKGEGIWAHLSVVRNYGTDIRVYQDGILVGTTGTFASTNYNAGGVIKVAGGSNTNISTCISLLRISASAPSAEQIKKMYEDEKYLFQENAKATLYGSSDAVTALAYDHTTELLHVGTSAGRSEFQGLRRINNTTTAVTTAISASNELVAEQ